MITHKFYLHLPLNGHVFSVILLNIEELFLDVIMPELSNVIYLKNANKSYKDCIVKYFFLYDNDEDSTTGKLIQSNIHSLHLSSGSK
jgi:hypothetical protein